MALQLLSRVLTKLRLVKVLVVRGVRATGCAIGKMSKLTESAANTVPYVRVPLGIQTPLPGSPPPPIASAQVLAQVPTQPAQEYDYDVEYIQVPVQREVQVPVSIPVTKTVPGTAALQAPTRPRPVVASWTEAERQEILRRGKETKAQEDLRRQKIQVCMYVSISLSID